MDIQTYIEKLKKRYRENKLAIIRYASDDVMYTLIYGRLQSLIICLRLLGEDLYDDFETKVPQRTTLLTSINTPFNPNQRRVVLDLYSRKETMIYLMAKDMKNQWAEEEVEGCFLDPDSVFGHDFTEKDKLNTLNRTIKS